MAWLWYPFIPYEKLTIVQGDPGDGKTTLVLNIAVKLSKGEGIDSEMKLTEPLAVMPCPLFPVANYVMLRAKQQEQIEAEQKRTARKKHNREAC